MCFILQLINVLSSATIASVLMLAPHCVLR